MNCKLCGDSGFYSSITKTRQVCACAVGIAIRERHRKHCNVPLTTKPLKLAFGVRRNIEAYVSKRRLDHTMRGLCAFASMSLAFAYDAADVSWNLCSGLFTGRAHVWLVHEKLIIDLTSTQFDLNSPRVLVAKECDSRWRPLNVFSDMQTLLTQPHGGGSLRIIKQMSKVNRELVIK